MHGRTRSAVCACVLAALAFTLFTGADPPKTPTGCFEVASRSESVRLRAVTPQRLGKGHTYGLVLFFAERRAEDALYLEAMLAEPDKLPALAEEMDAIFLFALPRAKDAAAQVSAVQAAQRDLLRSHPVDPARVTVVGHGGGALAAIKCFVADKRASSSLVLVSPAIRPDADEPPTATEPRPVLIVSRTGFEDTGAAARHRLLARRADTDVTMLSLPTLDRLPASHLATFVKYSSVVSALRQATSGSLRVPAYGSARARRLSALAGARAVLRRPDLGLGAPVQLRHAAGPPDQDRSFVRGLLDKARGMVPDGEFAQKIDDALAAARTQGDKRLALLKKSRLKGRRRHKAFDRFIGENGLWPDLIKAAREAQGTTGDGPEPSAAGPTEEQFLQVIRARCSRCHKGASASMGSLRKNRWVRPGQPERSMAYRVIGKHRRKGGTYHNVPANEKKIIHDFIKAMKSR